MKLDLITTLGLGNIIKDNCYPDGWVCKPRGGGGPCGPGADCYPSDCTPDRNRECGPDEPCYPDKCFPQK